MSQVTAVVQDLLVAPLVRYWCRPFRAIGATPSEGPLIFVANHASHLDAPAVVAALPRSARRRLAIAAAEDYFYRRRVVGRLVSLGVGAFPFPRRGRLGLDRAEALVASGWSVLLFPEGTRSVDGSQQVFKQGVGHLLLTTGVPVVPVALVGTHAAWPKGQRMPRRGSVCVAFGEAWRPDPHLTPAEIAQELAARCCAAGQAPAT